MSDEPYTGQFAMIRNRKVPIMNANGGSDCVCVQRVVISNAQLRSTTPVELIPAMGPNTYTALQHVTGMTVLPTGQPFVGTPVIQIGPNTTVLVTTAAMSTMLDDAGSRMITMPISNTVLSSTSANSPINFSLSAGLTGNANNDNYVILYLTYVVMATV